jgi:hypothetical protein
MYGAASCGLSVVFPWVADSRPIGEVEVVKIDEQSTMTHVHIYVPTLPTIDSGNVVN